MPILELLLTALLVLSAPGPGEIGGVEGEGPEIRLGLQRRPLPFPISLRPDPRLPLWVLGEGGGQPDPSRSVDGDPLTTAAGPSGSRHSSVSRNLLSPPSVGAPPLPTLSPPRRAVGGGENGPGAPGRPSPQEVPPGQERASIFQSEFAQLDFQLRGRGELGGDWNRFTPCEAGLQVSCDPGLFPQLKPDVQFGLQAGGTIADRIHVDVDYDETREFSATNNVNLFYEGQPGEFVQRMELGDVTLLFPESRYLTQGIPAGNFGFRALTETGPLSVQAVWAQQSGDISSREFELSGVGGREAFVQEDTLVLDDADFAQGQFFFLVDPREITGYPHLDVLSLEPGSAPSSLSPGAEPLQLYRFENDPVTRQQVEGYIQAEAVADRDGVTVTEAGWFRYLLPGVDYFLHPSGLWLALRRPLRREEMLAVTFITAAGDTVGDYNPERIHNAGGRPGLRLLKGSGPKHQPGSPTWEMEMHQVYRISGSDDVDASSVALSLSLGELSGGRTFKRRPNGEEITLLKLLGLDEVSPIDQVDPDFIYRPALEYFQDRAPVSGTFIVFPTLRPFAEPPPVPSLGLSAEETLEILGTDANSVIYDSVDPVLRENGALFRLTIPFRIRTEGLISTFSLGALGIRAGSERIYFGNRLLREGEEYVIDYDVGQVTLLSPDALFGADPQGRIRATWEQKAMFRIAPTSIFGLNARYGLGERGAVHLLGLYQQERTLQTRPQLGVEPSSILLGGLNGDLTFGASWLDVLAARVPGSGADSASFLQVRGEMALSVPNPNTEGRVYLDDFNSIDERPLSLLNRDWFLGSAPGEDDGAGGILPGVRDGGTAGSLVWQHTWILQGPGGDSLGIFEGFFPRRDIDIQINVVGTETRETGLRLTFAPPEGGEGTDPAWRSITSVLSNTGSDLSRTDFLEFYAAGGEALTLIFDLGRVSEDALFVDGEGRTSGLHPQTGEPWGLGFLDQEADPRKGEIWNDALDGRGVWVETCIGERGQIYPLGDPRANCTRGNGRNDTEDLDGNGNLATEDRVYRYVVQLDGSSPYLTRTREETGSAFQLYRVPLRGPLATNVGGLVTDADWRAVKHLRITVVGSDGQDALSLTRMRFLGSRWVKRGESGVLSGFFGDLSGTGGQLEVSQVSALTEGGGYQPPPGVRDELNDPTQAFGGQGVEFNEASLSIRVRDLGPGERAEVYSRFPQRPRDFLTYRQARLWVVATEGDWGMDGAEFFFKVGSDPDNFYLFRSARPPPAGEGGVVSSDWLPEIVVDFNEWLTLRRRAEEILIQEPPLPGGPPVEVWSPDSTYAVFLKDRARAPNLAAVRELSLGVWNPGVVPVQGTIWVNELRLGNAVQDPGLAGHVDIDLEAPNLLHASLSYSGQGAFFRQLANEASYQDDSQLAFSSSIELGRVAPAAWGVSVPVSVVHTRQGQEPTFLAQSDLRADRVPNLRRSGGSDTRVEVGFRKTTPTGVRVLDPILDGLHLRAGYTRNRFSTTTLESEGSGMDARAEYLKDVEARDVRLVPDFVEGIVRALLPARVEAAALAARLRWTPERIRLGTLYARRKQEAYRFEQVLTLPSDALVTPTLSPREALETTAQVIFRPLNPLSAEVTFFSVRDLLAPAEIVQDSTLHPLLDGERWGLGPLDLGWETGRNLRTRFGFSPSLASWLRTDLVLSTDYTSDRSAALVKQVPVGNDTLLLLQRNANGNRSTRMFISLDPRALLPSPAVVDPSAGEDTIAVPELGPDPGGTEEPGAGFWSRLVGAVDPVSLTRQGGLNSRFYRAPVDPGPGFQFGWGGREDLRFLQGDTASIFTGRTTWTAGTGVRLPLNLRVSGAYSDSRIDILHLRSDRAFRNRSWPDLRLTLSRVPLPERIMAVLRTLSLSSGYRKNLQETTFGGVGQQRRVGEERQVPLDVNAGWLGEINTRYQGSFADGEGLDPTGDTRSRRRSHTFTLSSVISQPPLLGDRLDGPLRVSVGYRYTSDLDCRVPFGQTECTPFVDYLDRSVNLTLDTRIIPLEVGLHVTYTDRQSFVGRHDGATQFQLGIFGQFVIDSRATSPPSTAPDPGGG